MHSPEDHTKYLKLHYTVVSTTFQAFSCCLSSVFVVTVLFFLSVALFWFKHVYLHQHGGKRSLAHSFACSFVTRSFVWTVGRSVDLFRACRSFVCLLLWLTVCYVCVLCLVCANTAATAAAAAPFRLLLAAMFDNLLMCFLCEFCENTAQMYQSVTDFWYIKTYYERFARARLFLILHVTKQAVFFVYIFFWFEI